MLHELSAALKSGDGVKSRTADPLAYLSTAILGGNKGAAAAAEPSPRPSRNAVFGIADSDALRRPFDGEAAETFREALADCSDALDAFAARAKVEGAEDWASLCELVGQRRRDVPKHTSFVPLDEVHHTINTILDGNSSLWVLSDELSKQEWLLRHRRVLATSADAHARDELLAKAALLHGQQQQLVIDSVVLSEVVRTCEDFDEMREYVEETLQESSQAAMSAVGRLLEVPPDEQEAAFCAESESLAQLCATLSSALSVCENQRCPCEFHVEQQSALCRRVIDLLDSIGKAGSVLQNPLRRGLPLTLALKIKSMRVDGGVSYGSIARRVARGCAHKDAAHDMAGYHGRAASGSAADGRLLCLAARQLLGELSSSHAVAWRQVGVTGPLIDRHTDPVFDAPSPSLLPEDSDAVSALSL